ncbi:MAG: DUF115 domain-containing protein [Treponema sp.]|nr:DUF115 domain-containing protein [Treponema sp.]
MNSKDLIQEIPARRGYSVSYGGKALLSKIDPVAQGERLATEASIKEKTLYICPSPLYGYGISVLLEKLPPNSAILCVEIDEKLLGISRKAMKAFIEEKACSLLHAASPENICAFIRKTYGERIFRRVEIIHLTGGWQLFPKLYEDLAHVLRREIALEWGNAMTMIHLGRLYARNLIRNLALLPESDNITAINFFSSPVLVLGAGPSLDSTLDGLSGFWGGKIPEPGTRAFKIICADTCLPALKERSILPDLVVILESQHWNLRDFIGSRSLGIDAFIDLSSLPASARVLNGKRFLFSTPWTELALFRRLEETGILPESIAPMGSVGLSAVALALRSGNGPVLTGGIDFSYTMDAYHACSTPGYIDMQIKQNRFRRIINAFREGSFTALSKRGNKVRSDPVMRNYRNLFEKEFGGNPRLIDIDGHGLPLGVKIVSIAEAFTILDEAGKTSPSASKLPENDLSGNKKIETQQIIGFIKKETDTLNTLKDILSGAISSGHDCLETLLETADYLWAHFPECAGAGGRRPPSTNLSFLKRVRTEIDPFLKLWKITLKQITNNK